MEKVNNQGYVYIKIVNGVYIFKQAGIIAHKEVIKYLASHGYRPVQYTPSYGNMKHGTPSSS